MKLEKCRLAALVFSAFVLIPLQGRTEDAPKTAKVRADMAGVYNAFQGLQKYLYDKSAFESEANDAEIGKLVGDLSQGVHRVGDDSGKYKNEPGFESTLKVLNEMLDDAARRYKEGKKGYTLWRLKTAQHYCTTCHTSFAVDVTFSDAYVDVSHLTSYEKGEFYLASRQIEKAKAQFIEAVKNPPEPFVRMDALRKVLVIYVRVVGDPQAAIKELNKIRAEVKLNSSDDEEVKEWLESLRRWMNEPKTPIDPVRKAENLIGQALNVDEEISGQKGVVEILRATALLHKTIDEKQPTKEGRGHVLFLLGKAYSELPFFFINELPELFLEQCIRENPGTGDAKRAFRLYQEVVSLGYTGSGGTRLPDDVVLTFKELHDIAYGVPRFEEKL